MDRTTHLQGALMLKLLMQKKETKNLNDFSFFFLLLLVSIKILPNCVFIFPSNLDILTSSVFEPDKRPGSGLVAHSSLPCRHEASGELA